MIRMVETAGLLQSTASSRKTSAMELFATCAWGLESVLGEELRTLGLDKVRPLTGGVSFHGDMRAVCTALLWSRVASRILLVLDRVSAADSDELYEGAKAIPWEDHIEPGRTIAIAARGTNDALRDTRFTSLRVKDAICDRLREVQGERPSVDPANPDVLVQVTLRSNRATLFVDLSGVSLENRGYRDAHRGFAGELRETLAAAMLLKAGWASAYEAGSILLDPVCASGTIAIEAALMACDNAPGIARSHWGFLGWKQHDQALWDELIDDADRRAQDTKRKVFIHACEAREDMLECARQRAKRAGIADAISFSSDAGRLPVTAGLGFDVHALLACNLMTVPNYVPATLPALYASISTGVHENPAVRTCALLSGDQDISASLDFEETGSFESKNGNEPCAVHVYTCAQVHASDIKVEVRGQELPVRNKGAQQFADRLNKLVKQRRKWAKQNKIYAYRVYDADLPDFNMAIDVYNGAGQDEGRTCVHVAEYAPPKQIDPEKAASRMADALAIIGVVFEVPMECVFVKRRKRAKGGSQYALEGSKTQAGRDDAGQAGMLITRENGLKFELDLANYLDTGLFLDHRDTRALLAKLVPGKSFLNLFAYTGSVSVYAAAAGAKFTTTVDLSNTYLQWAQRNMELNGLMNVHQEFERADCIAWIQEKRHTKMRWDFIFVDPPTFSNSTKMGKRTWDVQRDHAELLIGASRLLTRGGVMMFSCNLRNFKPDVDALARAGVAIVDITEKTIPADFERNPQIHHCYLLRRA